MVWISVKQQTPELKQKDGVEMSEMVVCAEIVEGKIVRWGKGFYAKAEYDSAGPRWRVDDFGGEWQPTHWFYLPGFEWHKTTNTLTFVEK